MPRCYRCGEERRSTEFARDGSKARGHKSICKACDRAKSRTYYEHNFARKLAAMAETRARRRLRSPRACERCGRPATSQRHRFCDACRLAAARRRPRTWVPKVLKTTERGYGAAHKRLRRRWAREIKLGGVRCARGAECKRAERVGGVLVGGLIDWREPWDLGHEDEDRGRYSGPEHSECNRATSGRKRRSSRPW